ncbi:RnfABCDGE type electron transport complex subunit D [Pseudooceanicola sp.]|uniref:RnfABCDGE type electron transport complex subunit D n=1 Tax=Pseudooceanicola sp. TaxID=1914328 RepID=UPI0026128BAB|nr:RnfABCDGE type electron transport complex subunit D [Pseudooceanicola sp.]MDF1855945.1 RnfABCDGE type electron transport complex subunit D [Pseudooceanicola sp.]
MWSRETVALFLVIAMLPLAVVWLTGAGWDGAIRLLAALAITYGWQLAFLLLRAQPPSLAGVVTAFAIAVLAPTGLGAFAFVLGVSFGVVIGELAFGGWGRNILHPATVAIAFLGFGYPAAPWPELSILITWGACGTLALAVAFGLYAIRLVAGTAIALSLAALVGLPVTDPFTAPAILASFALLVCDPVTSANTQTGRWMQGLFYGALIALFLAVWDGAATTQLALSAALLANLAAPLLDEIALLLWQATRRNRHG